MNRITAIMVNNIYILNCGYQSLTPSSGTW